MRPLTCLATLLLAVSSPLLASASICEMEIEQPLTGRAFYFSADTPRWQEFVPARYLVCEIWLNIRAEKLGGDLILQVQDDVGATIETITIPEAQITLGDATYRFDYPVGVDKDELHRLVLSTSEPDVFPAAYFWKGDEASAYGDGVSDVDGAGVPGFDYAFSVYTVTSTDAPPGRGPSPVTFFDPAPNPFNPTTAIAFELRSGMHVRVSVHDVAGRQLRVLSDQWWETGPHALPWDGHDGGGRVLASGPYLVRLEAEGFRETKRVVLLK